MDEGRLLAVLRHRNPWWRGDAPSEGVARDELRDLQRAAGRDFIIALTGMRRVGKSTLMQQMIGALLRDGVPATEILAVDFEDYELASSLAEGDLLEQIFETYRRDVRPSGKPFLFLDEIQDAPDWARWARSLHERGQAHVVVSGSSSRLIEPKLLTVLTGRHQAFLIRPLAFTDYVTFRRAVDRSRSETSSEALGDFLKFGGLPRAAIELDPAERERILKQIYNQILLQDITARHEIRSHAGLARLAHHLLRHTGCLVSFNKLREALSLSMDQVRGWCEHLEARFLVDFVRRLHPKESVVENSERKVYVGDLGLRHAVTLRFSPDLGHLAETAVYHQLRRHPLAEVRYFRGDRSGAECDFVLWHGDKALMAVQVCYTSDEVLPPRELEGLLGAMTAYGLSEGVIVTESGAAREELDGRVIRRVPLVDWLRESAVGEGA